MTKSPGAILSEEYLNEKIGEKFAQLGGSGGGGNMNERLTRLEVEFEHVRKDLDDIKGDVKSILTQVADQPTTTNFGPWD